MLVLSTSPDEKYYDRYTYGNYYTTHGWGKLGDATKETLKTFGNYEGGWYSDYMIFVYSTKSWFYRGGFCKDSSKAGVFYLNSDNGSGDSARSSRAVICVQE